MPKVSLPSVLQTHVTIQEEICENKGTVTFLERSKSKWKFQKAYSGTGRRSKGTSALLTAQAQRSLKDYTADCQREVQSSGLRNQRIRVQGLGVLCPTRDKTATRCMNHRGGHIRTTSVDMQGHPWHFIYSSSSSKGLHHGLWAQQEYNASLLFVNNCPKQLSMQ